MVLPEPALFRSSQGRECSGQRLFVRTKGKIFKNHFHTFRILVEHLLEKRHKFAAVGSLKVAEDCNDDPGICGPHKGGIRHIELNDETNINFLQGLTFAVD